MRQIVALGIAVLAIDYGASAGQLAALIVGVVLGALALSGRLGQANEQLSSRFSDLLIGGWQTGWIQIAIIPLALSALAGLISLQQPLSPMSGILWLLSIVIMLGAGFQHDRAESAAASATYSGWTRLDWMLIAAVSVSGLVIRLYQIDDFLLPPLHGDEGEMGLLALLVLHNHNLPPDQRVPLFGVAFLGHPTLFHYLQAAALLVFGQSGVGLRILSAIFGALCIPTI